MINWLMSPVLCMFNLTISMMPWRDAELWTCWHNPLTWMNSSPHSSSPHFPPPSLPLLPSLRAPGLWLDSGALRASQHAPLRPDLRWQEDGGLGHPLQLHRPALRGGQHHAHVPTGRPMEWLFTSLLRYGQPAWPGTGIWERSTCRVISSWLGEEEI